MLKLINTLNAWNTPSFEIALKQEIARNAAHLPLQQGLASGNYVTDAPLTLVIHGYSDMGDTIQVRAGIFYQGVIGGCSCADDPSPAGETAEYCEVRLEIDKASATTSVILVNDA